MLDITHDALATTALERVMKARVELITTRTFYGVLVAQVTPVITDKVPTMATNGKQHFVNPKFVAGLKKNHLGKEVAPGKLLLGVQAHESEHDARRHHTRRGNRDPLEWNICTDYSINVDLIDEGFELPEGALIDRKYKGMSAEDIYRSREIDRALQKQKEEEERQKQQEQEEQEEQQEEQNDNRDVDGNDAPDSDESETGEDESETGDDTGEDAGDDGDNESDAGDNAGEEESEDGSPEGNSTGSASGNPEGEPSEEGAGEAGEEEATDLADTDGTASGGAAGEAGEGSETGETTEESDDTEPSSIGDPGQCGEVLDAADDTAELSNEDARWETILRQAAMLSAKRGTAPGHVARELEHADHPPQDWRETLRAFYDAGATVRETWSRPNRRFVGSGLYLPGREREGINRAVFLIDTSGSVTYYPGALEAIAVESQAALDEGFIDELVVVYGDTQVTRVDTFRSGDEIEFDPRGGGGTYMKPLFDYVRNELEASCIVCFTDLEIEPESMLGPQPDCPVLWAVVGYPERVKQYLKATPWGADGIEVVPSYN